ncbi:MAG: YggS family pyridoxal phosphate-dependent enzyme [Candidatus Brocadiia bacterium]
MASEIAEKYAAIREELPENVDIIAAAKTRSADEIAESIGAGVKMVGENYVQEAERVISELGARAEQVEWHMIGHLQRNKINKALPVFDVIQSVDSPRLARGINKRVDEPIRVFVEVNIAGEESKYGVPPEELSSFFEEISECEMLRVGGLMGMEPYFDDPEKARPYLQRLKGLFDEMQTGDWRNVELKTLSMGMSNSYRVAVEEGSNMVRIGTAIYGPRP